MRVVHVIPDFEAGGAERALFELVRQQRGRLEVVLAPFAARGAMHRDFRQLGVPIVELGLRREDPLRGLAALRAAARLGRLCAPASSILHAHMWHADMLCRLVGSLVRRPVVATCQLARLPRPRALLDRATRAALGARIGVSEDVVTFVARELGGSCTLIENPRSPVAVLPRDEARVELALGPGSVVGCLARLDEQKDPALFADCVRRLRSDHPLLTAMWIGGGPAARRFTPLLDRAGVRRAGYRADGARLLAAFDVHLFTSRWEGFPLTLLECWSAGVPVVAPDVPGLRSQLGAAGLLVPRRPEALAAAVARLLADPDLRARVTAAGRAAFARFTPADIARRTEEVYRRVGSPSPSTPFR